MQTQIHQHRKTDRRAAPTQPNTDKNTDTNTKANTESSTYTNTDANTDMNIDSSDIVYDLTPTHSYINYLCLFNYPGQ